MAAKHLEKPNVSQGYKAYNSSPKGKGRMTFAEYASEFGHLFPDTREQSVPAPAPLQAFDPELVAAVIQALGAVNVGQPMVFDQEHETTPEPTPAPRKARKQAATGRVAPWSPSFVNRLGATNVGDTFTYKGKKGNTSTWCIESLTGGTRGRMLCRKIG